MHYLLGALQWFGEPLTAVFTFLLLMTALVTSLHHQLPVRQLTGAVLVVPLAFAATGLLRALWAMRATTGCTVRDAFQALRVWFALSWVVTLACARGLISGRAEFLRTPKKKEGAALLHALWASRAETVLAVAAIAGGVAMIVRAPGFATAVLGGLLIFEALIYGSAPAASIAAERIQMTPAREAWAHSPQNTGDRPPVRRGAVVAGALALLGAAGAVLAALVVNSPSDQAPFGNGNNLPTIGSVAPNIIGQAGSTPTPSPSATPSSSASASPSPTASATPTPTATATPTAATTPTPTLPAPGP